MFSTGQFSVGALGRKLVPVVTPQAGRVASAHPGRL